MRKSRFTESQIIGMIKEQEAGMPTAEVCRRHGLSPATFYKMKAKYGGMEVSEAARLKALEDENAKLKRLLADTMLDKLTLNSTVPKPWRSTWLAETIGMKLKMFANFDTAVGSVCAGNHAAIGKVFTHLEITPSPHRAVPDATRLAAAILHGAKKAAGSGTR